MNFLDIFIPKDLSIFLHVYMSLISVTQFGYRSMLRILIENV